MTRTRLSVFIIAQNEADRIPSCIKSVIDWVDEVIVVDSGSTDGTQEIAQKLGAKVIPNEWHGYGPQKRFAEEQCCNRWVLNLDADESVTPELAEEIVTLFKDQPPQTSNAYRIKIQSVYPVHNSPGRFPFTYNNVRLYHLDKGRFSNSPIHDSVVFSEKINYIDLKYPVHHFCIRSLTHLISKTNHYTDLQANTYLEKGRKVNPIRLLFEFPFSFIKSYIFQGHFLRGWYGFILAHQYASNRFMRIAKLWEKQKIESKASINSLG